MQKILISLFLFAAGLVPATSPAHAQSTTHLQSPPQAQSSLHAQSPAPAREIKKMKMAELEDYIRQCDHPLIVNFWATYCAPCLKEIPYLQSTAEQYRDSGVELLLVSLDPPADHSRRITAFAKQTNIVAKLAWLDKTDAGNFYPRIDKKWSGGIPASLFINNKWGYRKFFDRQLTDRQVEQQLKLLVTSPEQS